MIRVGAEGRVGEEFEEAVLLRARLLLLLCCCCPDGGATAGYFLRSEPPAGDPTSGTYTQTINDG